MATKPSTSNASSNNRANGPSGSKQQSNTARKTVVTYRPVSKTKRSLSRVGLSACTSATGKINKSPEDLRDELIDIKKSMASVMEENALLKAKIRRRDEENLKKDKQILQLLEAEKNEELRRVLTEKKSTANMSINQLKQRVLKLELALKEKEQSLKRAQGDLKASKINEMKIQLETYYQEILRLKTLSHGRHNENGTSLSYDDLLHKYKTLLEENKSLKKELDRALAIEGILPANGDYHSLSKIELLATITDLEKKLSSQTSLGSIGLIKVKLGSSQEGKEKSELEDTDEKVKQLREDRFYYHQLAENRDAEIKRLSETVTKLQKKIDQLNCSRRTTTQIAVQPSSMSQSSNSDVDVLPVSNPVSIPVSNPVSTPRVSTARMSTARVSSAPPTTSKQRIINLQEPFVMSSTVRKIPSNKSASAKRSQTTTSTTTTTTTTAYAKQEVNSMMANNQAYDMYKLSAYNYCNYNYCYNYCYNYDYNYDYTNYDPSRMYQYYGDPRKAMPQRNDVRAMMRRAGFRATDNDMWIMQATVRKVVEKKVEPNNQPPPKSSGRPAASSSKRPATYTMLKGPEQEESSSSVEEKKTKAAGDSKREVDFQQVQLFRQNLAAKKIQQRWKRYQDDLARAYIRANSAALTIQQGWKKHRVKIFTYSDRSLFDTAQDQENLQVSDNVMASGESDALESDDHGHDDDDDVVCQ